MKRILVLGCGGAGKSTFARRLGKAIKIEVLHLDAFYWNPGWIEPSDEEWAQTIDKLVHRDSWIMDGNYGGTLERRTEACDTIIFIDRSRWLCLWRILKRRVQYLNNTRPDIAPGCPEKIDLDFISWIWAYSHHTKPRVVSVIERSAQTKRIIWLRSEEQIEDFFDSLCVSEVSNDC